MSNDDRPLYVLASRAAVILRVPLLDGEHNCPSDPRLRATRLQGVVVTEAHRENAPVWLEFGRGLTGGTSWELIATDGKKLRRTVVEGRTPKAFREAFDAMERGIEAVEALRPWRVW